MKSIIGHRVIILLACVGIIFVSFGCSNAVVATKTPPIQEVAKESPPPVDEYQSFMNDGIDRFTRGEYNEAISFFLKAKELKPREGDVHYWLFQAYKNTEKKITSRSNAYIEAQNVVALMPDSPRAKHAQDFLNSIEKASAPPKIVKTAPKPQATVYIVQKPIQQKPTIVRAPVVPPPLSDTPNNINQIRVPSYNNNVSQAEAYRQKLEQQYKEKAREQARLDAIEKEQRDRQRELEDRAYKAQMKMYEYNPEHERIQAEKEIEKERNQILREAVNKPAPTQTVKIEHRYGY
jgi:hypothetical protein